MTSETRKKLSVLPSGGGAMLMDPADTAILLLDHQSGLFQTVKDVPVADLRRNVEMIAKLATLLNIPVITTASEPSGPNGPLMPEIGQDAPHAVYVPRKGEVNAWDNDDFVDAVKYASGLNRPLAPQNEPLKASLAPSESVRLQGG